MAVTLETIRQITIRARAEGVEQAERALSRMAGAQRQVAGGADAVATATDRQDRSILSSASQFDKLVRSIDPAVKKMAEYEAGVRKIAREEALGKRSAEEIARAYGALEQRYFGVEKAAEAASRAMRANALIGPPDGVVSTRSTTPGRSRPADFTTLASRSFQPGQEPDFSRLWRPMTQGAKEASQAVALTSSQLANLSFQVNDVATSLLSGQSPFMVMVQQGGQVYQILQQGQGGVGGSLRGIGSTIAGLITPVRLLTAGLVGMGIAGAAAFVMWQREQDRLAASLDGLGRRTGLTLGGLNTISGLAADQSNISRSTARGLVGQMTQSGAIAPDMIGELAATAKTFARVTGVDIEEAGEKLASAFSDPSRGADELNRRLGFLDDRTRQLIRTMQAQGDVLGAQRQLFDALEKNLQQVEDRTWSIAKGWDAIKRGVSNAGDSVAQGLQETFSPLAMQQLQDAAGAIGRRGGLRGPAVDESLRDYAYDLSEQIRRQQQLAALRAREADAIQRSLTVGDAVRSAMPDVAQFRGLTNEVELFREALDRPDVYSRVEGGLDAVTDAMRRKEAIVRSLTDANGALITTEERQARLDALAVQMINARTVAERARIAAEQARLQAAGSPDFEERGRSASANIFAQSTRDAEDKLRSSQDNLALAGLPDYGRQLGEINAKYREQIELATGNAKAIEALEAARAADIRALNIETFDRPMREANEALDAQIRLLGVQAGSFMQSTREQVRAATAQKMLNDFMAQGIPITKELRGEIESYADRSGRLAEINEEIEKSQAKVIDGMDQFRSNFKSGFKDLLEGDVKGALSGFADMFMDRALDSFSESLFGAEGKPGGGIFGDALSGLFGGGIGAKPSGRPGDPVHVAMDGGGLVGGIASLLSGRPTNDNVSGGFTGLGAQAGVEKRALAPITPLGMGGIGSDARFPLGDASARLSGDGTVQSQVWNFFAGKGLKPHQIAGIMGNVGAESAFNPSAIGDNGKAFGLFQHWGNRGGGPGLLGNPQGALDLAWSELQTSESGVLQRLMASTDVRGATSAFAGFERPRGWSLGNPEASHNFVGRLAGAEAALQKFGSTTQATTGDLGVLGKGFGAFGNALGSMTAGGAQAGGGGGGFGGLISSLLGGVFSLFGFADGGVTNRPAIFGEAGPEAAVPLPDGRRIPVDLRHPPKSSAREPMQVSFGGPTITVQGNADERVLRQLRMEIADAQQQTLEVMRYQSENSWRTG